MNISLAPESLISAVRMFCQMVAVSPVTRCHVTRLDSGIMRVEFDLQYKGETFTDSIHVAEGDTYRSVHEVLDNILGFSFGAFCDRIDNADQVTVSPWDEGGTAGLS